MGYRVRDLFKGKGILEGEERCPKAAGGNGLQHLPGPGGDKRRNSLHPTYCPEVWGPVSAAWRVLGKEGERMEVGQLEGLQGARWGPGWSRFTEAWPSYLQPHPARPSQASSC